MKINKRSAVSRTAFAIVILVLVVGAAGAGYYYYYLNTSQSTTTTTSTGLPSTTASSSSSTTLTSLSSSSSSSSSSASSTSIPSSTATTSQTSTTTSLSTSSAPTTTTATGSSSARDLTVGTTQKLRWLDSQLISNSIEVAVGSQIFEPLLRNDPQTGVPQPWLAESYNVSSDGLVYTFHLRQGVKFQDGAPFTADAVKSSFLRDFANPQSLASFVGTTLAGANASNLANSTANAIQVIDNNTIAFHLSAPFSSENYLFAMANTGISSPLHNNATLDQYVGTGPYKFVSWTRDDNVKLVPNPDYWNTANLSPNIKSITIKFYSSATAMQSALVTKAIDVALWDFTPTQVKDLEQMQNLKTINGEIGRFIALDLNNNSGSSPLNNLLVRQAIAYALNTTQIVETAYGPIAVASQTFLPPNYPYVSQAFAQTYHYNITKAKQLLTQAGYPNGFSTTLWYSPTQYGEAETPFVTLVQQQLAQVGITVTLKPVEITAFIQGARQGLPPMLSFHWIYDYFGPYQYLWNIMQSGPTGFWSKFMSYNDPQSDQLLSQIAQTNNQSELPTLYNQLQERAVTTIPLVPLGFIQDVYFSQTYVNGLQAKFLGSSASNALFANVSFTG